MSILAEIKKERVFEFYPNFPPEVQMMVIDEMCPDERCRFRRCSKFSDKQARLSKKYMYALEIRYDDYDSIKIHVVFNNYHQIYDDPACGLKHIFFGFELNFKKEDGKNILRCSDFFERREHWRMELCPTIDLLHLAVQKYKQLLNVHQNSIRRLNFNGEPAWKKLMDLGFGIEKLRNLEDIEGSGIDLKPLFSLIPRPLKHLKVNLLQNNENPSNCEEIYRVQNILEMSSLKLNYEQFLGLEAQDIEVNIGYLTERDIINFIKSWQNGLVRENLTSCVWDIEKSNFAVNQVFGCFEENIHSRLGSKDVWIKNKKYSSKIAQLSYIEPWYLMLSIRDC